MFTSVDTLLFCDKYILAIPVFTTGIVLKLNTLSTRCIISPLIHEQSACRLVTWWVDGLVAGIYNDQNKFISNLLCNHYTDIAIGGRLAM